MDRDEICLPCPKWAGLEVGCLGSRKESIREGRRFQVQGGGNTKTILGLKETDCDKGMERDTLRR